MASGKIAQGLALPTSVPKFFTSFFFFVSALDANPLLSMIENVSE